MTEREAFAALQAENARLVALLESHGITPDDWLLIQKAHPIQHRGSNFVTPDAIYATGDPRAGEVVAKFIGMISDESEVAVLNPDLTTRAIVTGGGAPGPAGMFSG